MKKFIVLMMLALPVSAADLNFTWDSPSDPSKVDETRLYQVGNATPAAVIPMPENTASVDMGQMAPGEYCFYATFANAEVESDHSNTACATILETPQNFTISITITAVAS